MRIHVKARSFFEARQGTPREAALLAKYRIISINNAGFPAEPPPFSEEHLNSKNLLVLYFDDVEAGPNAMTPEQAKRIADFVCTDDGRPIFVHCTAGVSRSGAVGSELNWYFNRRLKNDMGDCLMFEIMHRDLVPNDHVRRLLRRELERAAKR